MIQIFWIFTAVYIILAVLAAFDGAIGVAIMSGVAAITHLVLIKVLWKIRKRI